MDPPNPAEFSGAQYGPETLSTELASGQSPYSTLDEHELDDVPRSGLAAGVEWVHGSKGEVGDEDLPSEDFRGGRGGRGGSGGMGTPNGSNGSDGSSGRNGFDGSPGRGGSIAVTYDPQAKPFLTAMHLSNRGGPPPVFKEELVAPLW